MNNSERRRFSPWIVIAGILVACYVALAIYLLNSPPAEGTTIAQLSTGFIGNLSSGVLVSLLFLLIALHTDAQTESKIDRIRGIVEDNDTRAEIERKIKEFERFLHEDPYYDVRFPDLQLGKQTLGLCYTVEPVRDEHGKPRERVMAFSSYYIVRVVSPAYEEVMDEDTLLDYEMSPICEDEFYYCRFFNSDWHMGKVDGGHRMHRFYMSGSSSPIQYAQSANRFIGAAELPSGFVVVKTFYLLPTGLEPDRTKTESVYKWELLKDSKGHPYVRSDDSRPKRVYKTTEENTFASNAHYTVIANIRGHFGGDFLRNFVELVEKKCEESQVSIPKYEWHEVEKLGLDR